MTQADIRIKVGASTPDTVLHLKRPGSPDTPLPLAGATVTLKARHKARGDKIEKTLTVTDIPTAEVSVDWTAEETATLTRGDYRAEIHVAYPDGEMLILPATGAYLLVVEEALAP